MMQSGDPRDAVDGTDATPSVAVIIRCRNEEAHIGRLLTGIARQTHQPSEIIIVDSGSTDATLAIAGAFPVKIVQIEPEDFSFGAACNVGCENVTADLAIFVSAHCYPLYDSWIARLIAPFGDEEVALSYGRQVGPPDARFPEQRLFAQWFPEKSVARQKIPFCNNANAAIRMKLWRDGYRYDEDLTGLEDLAWAKRAIEDGRFVSYAADAPVVHVHDETTSQVVNRYRREAIAHREIDDKQAMRLRQAVRLATVNIAQDLSAARREGVLKENIVDIPRFRTAQFFGTFRGFTQNGQVTEALKRRFYFPEEKGESAIESEVEFGERIDYDEPIDPSELK
jgi:glycosyltransferase involved in cell wall biosynthesis